MSQGKQFRPVHYRLKQIREQAQKDQEKKSTATIITPTSTKTIPLKDFYAMNSSSIPSDAVISLQAPRTKGKAWCFQKLLQDLKKDAGNKKYAPQTEDKQAIEKLHKTINWKRYKTIEEVAKEECVPVWQAMLIHAGFYLTKDEIDKLKQCSWVTHKDIRKLLESHGHMYEWPGNIEFAPEFGAKNPTQVEKHRKLFENICNRGI